jgi:hypothetical protein
VEFEFIQVNPNQEVEWGFYSLPHYTSKEKKNTVLVILTQTHAKS